MANFSEASLSLLFRTGFPLVDMFTGGAGSRVLDEVGDRAAACKIACTEGAEFFAAVEAAARGGQTEDQIHAVVLQARDLPEALKLLKDPSATVQLDGESVTADDDLPEDPAVNE